MTAQLTIVALVSLLVGIIAGIAGGYRLARDLHQRRLARLPEGEPTESDDTRPTLIPFRPAREAGRKLARVAEPAPDHLDALLSKFDKRS